MPTKRTPRNRDAKRRITPAAVEAFQANDYKALHRALGLKPWEMSPLPRDIEPLGCDPERPPNSRATLFDQSFEQAVELQRALLEAVQ
ncbi:hypothetical protein EOA60_03080 [Mesorhizobium sp. M1A.F.Ca.IN.020.06.1.1]|uniref:hypothetical protein n=1 Tax=unclassified Mesorhizobium TaxID=325217 RepID=UPI000FCCC8E1|nr:MULTISPECIES: hypothetical protein [unclassified Mesorhizobium]RUU99681.1 hypothetical protein EOA79_21525 [Mesorhizobium sp. M1A.F.Ca.IN.020.03.2.1]RUV88181.1 hypothetical protein EOA51_08180 [Mesorhizobium sp. M1A.F.Ca.IN.020.32.1.1]RUW04537.1 hypothetical protein EOA46_30755 [Mesorhizobium sp. M1A.F.Ca.IN.022.05.2.1]RUW36240.1 hypothetical protein EOA60_03080 [Mesorhizobium sp. M1A.F.Ca.IN.020.06.1.1]RWF82372.1 MAG: hypothetical protein EOQ35_10500 [Mesorhizobium sp.]